MKKIILPLIILFTANFVNAYTFQRDLTIGYTGEDVRQLQIYLNNYSSQTQVSFSGAGSKGNETTYFGYLTRQALANFQKLSNINPAVGYFGPITRAYISNQNEQQVSTSSNFLETETIIENNGSYDYFLMLSKNTISPDDEIVVGSIYEIENVDFYLNNKKIDKECKTPNTCKLKIEDAKEGYQTLSTSNSTIKTEEILVVKSSAKPKISLKTIKLNAVNEIKGSNLSDEITVYTSFGSQKVKTKNNTFELKIETPLTEVPVYLEKGPINVINSNGLSSDIIIVNYEI